MTTIFFRILPIVFVCLTFTALARAQKAILHASATTVRVRVNLAPEINPTAQPSSGGLYSIDDNKNWSLVAPLPAIDSPFTEFDIAFPRDRYNPKHEHRVVLFGSFKDNNNVMIQPSQIVVVTVPLVLSIVRDDPVGCGDGLTLLAEAKVDNYNWDPYYEWLGQFETMPSRIATITFQVAGGAAPVNVRVTSVSIDTLQSTAITRKKSRTCLRTEPDIPTTTFKVTANLSETRLPVEIARDLSASDLAPASVVALPKPDDFKPDTGNRKLERNLDLGVSLTSSVADEELAATATTPKTIVRKRTTRGILDVRFAPWMNVLKPEIAEEKWMHFLTPFYLNANVATGKITKETLSLNRILMGLEGELRYYTSRRWEENGLKRHSNPIWHRVKYGVQHASDRDFKQDEFTGKIEYAPIFEVLYKPYKFNFGGATGEKVQKWYGYAFQPRAGFEIGRTYHRENPAEVIKPSANVRRFYFGGDLSFDLTGHTSFSITDLFYIRGELPENRSQNYFKSSFDLLFRPSNVTSSGIFLSFERGQLPPFATPPANVFKVGFRVVSNYCKGACR